jgi:lysophospholipase
LNASIIGPLIDVVNETFPQNGIRLDTAVIPNPFLGVAPNSFLDRNEALLNIVDGGEDGEVVPIQPMLVKSRGVDVIIAIDAVRCTAFFRHIGLFNILVCS